MGLKRRCTFVRGDGSPMHHGRCVTSSAASNEKELCTYTSCEPERLPPNENQKVETVMEDLVSCSLHTKVSVLQQPVLALHSNSY